MKEEWGRLLGEVRKRWFIVSLVAVILLAKSYPYLGSKEGKLLSLYCASLSAHTQQHRARAHSSTN